MKIQVVSDLHNEFGIMPGSYERIMDTPADVLVLAGDIASHNTIIPLLKDIAEDCGKPVLYVPGNHEYYGTKRADLDKKFKAACSTNLQILLEKEVIIGGVAFIGTTGWWDGSGGTLGLTVQHGLNDFRMIHDVHENGNGVWWGQKARSFIEGRLYYHRANNPDMKRVVITHHFPHRRSIAPAFQGSLLNVCFYNAWEDIISEYNPEVWIHGHTHNAFDYIVSNAMDNPDIPYEDLPKTRIVCNPQGYPEKFAVSREAISAHYKKYDLVATEPDYNVYATTENEKFDPQKVIEL